MDLPCLKKNTIALFEMLKNSLFALVLLFVVISCSNGKKETQLPIYGERETTTKIVDGKQVVDTIYHTIPPFRYLNQDSVWVDETKIKGKIYLADFFFTSCPSICPKMTSQLKRLQAKTKDIQNSYHILSFSIDPDRDTPTQFKRYITQFNLDISNWDLLTGNEAETHRLGVEGFIVHARRDENVQGGFAHSPSIVLVDKQSRIRGLYDGTSTEEMNQAEKDLRELIHEDESAHGS